jgi:hypothetical protein
MTFNHYFFKSPTLKVWLKLGIGRLLNCELWQLPFLTLFINKQQKTMTFLRQLYSKSAKKNNIYILAMLLILTLTRKVLKQNKR